jgi:hypothetical protein
MEPLSNPPPHTHTHHSSKSCEGVQENFLSGRENQTGNTGQMDFKGTLKERRMKYQDRRDVQGQDTSRFIKRMREESGLGHDDPDNGKSAAV